MGTRLSGRAAPPHRVSRDPPRVRAPRSRACERRGAPLSTPGRKADRAGGAGHLEAPGTAHWAVIASDIARRGQHWFAGQLRRPTTSTAPCRVRSSRQGHAFEHLVGRARDGCRPRIEGPNARGVLHPLPTRPRTELGTGMGPIAFSARLGHSGRASCGVGASPAISRRRTNFSRAGGRLPRVTYIDLQLVGGGRQSGSAIPPSRWEKLGTPSHPRVDGPDRLSSICDALPGSARHGR